MIYVNGKTYANFNNLDITLCFYIILIYLWRSYSPKILRGVCAYLPSGIKFIFKIYNASIDISWLLGYKKFLCGSNFLPQQIFI